MADITPESMRRANETFRAAQAARAAKRKGFIAGTAQHRLVVSDTDNRVSHTVMATLRTPAYGEYFVVYASLPSGIDQTNWQEPTFYGMAPTYFGPSFGHLRIPITMSVARYTLPADLTYVGFDFLGWTKQPHKIDVAAALTQMAKGLFAPRDSNEVSDAASA